MNPTGPLGGEVGNLFDEYKGFIVPQQLTITGRIPQAGCDPHDNVGQVLPCEWVHAHRLAGNVEISVIHLMMTRGRVSM